jgi:hypothetical protein
MLSDDEQYSDWAASCLGIRPEQARALFGKISSDLEIRRVYNFFMESIQLPSLDDINLFSDELGIQKIYKIPKNIWKRFFIYVRGEIIHNNGLFTKKGGKKSRYKKRTRAIKYRHKKSVKVYRSHQKRSRQQRRLRS